MLSKNNKLVETQIRLWRGHLKKTVMEAFDLMPEDKLDWAPAKKMMTLGQVFLHIAETSDWWYDDVMKNRECTELAIPGEPCPPKEKIREHLDDHWERMERFFAEPPEILERVFTREFKDWNLKKDGYWIFTHLFEHDIHHRSQINHYLRILGIRPPEV